MMRPVNSDILDGADIYHISGGEYMAYEYFREFEPTLPSIIWWLTNDTTEVIMQVEINIENN